MKVAFFNSHENSPSKQTSRHMQYILHTHFNSLILCKHTNKSDQGIPMNTENNNLISAAFTKTEDTYKAIGIYIGHLSKPDREALKELSEDGEVTMVMERDTGFFVKLYDEAKYNVYGELSDLANNILAFAYEAGFRMIEFDCDATAYDCLPCFDEVCDEE